MSDDLEMLADPERLTAWLDSHVPGLGNGPLVVQKIHGGTSNVILSLERGGDTLVLRRPPATPPPGSEKSIMREARVLTALRSTDVPHPYCHGQCADPEVIGAPFYVMELVEGWPADLRDGRIYDREPFDKPPYAREVPLAMVDGLIALAKADYKAVGLEDFGHPDNFLERQVDRWERQMTGGTCPVTSCFATGCAPISPTIFSRVSFMAMSGLPMRFLPSIPPVA